MARSQQIELKLGQALRVCSHLGKLEIGGLADELEFEHDPKWGGRPNGSNLTPVGYIKYPGTRRH